MYFQFTDISERAAKGSDAGNDGHDARTDSVFGHLQQHDNAVHDAHACEQIIDRPCLKQITHADRIDDGDRLKQDFLNALADVRHFR